MGRFLDPSLRPKTLWKNLDSIGVRDEDFAPVDICPDRLNSFFTSSSNVRRPTVKRSTRDVFIAIHQIGSNVITHIFNTSMTCFPDMLPCFMGDL
jgi:hypothetical protein